MAAFANRCYLLGGSSVGTLNKLKMKHRKFEFGAGDSIERAMQDLGQIQRGTTKAQGSHT
jgi:hypothetical protein